jgi:hypothetical protein
MVNHSEKYCNIFLSTPLKFMNIFLGHRKDLTPRALKSEKELMPICRCKILSRTRRKDPTTPHDVLPMFSRSRRHWVSCFLDGLGPWVGRGHTQNARAEHGYRTLFKDPCFGSGSTVRSLTYRKNKIQLFSGFTMVDISL